MRNTILYNSKYNKVPNNNDSIIHYHRSSIQELSGSGLAVQGDKCFS